MLTVLIVEDNLMIADAAEELLVRAGYGVRGIAATVATAVTLAQIHWPDLLLVDLQLGGGGLGSHVARQLGNQARCGILYTTGNLANVTLTDMDGTRVSPSRIAGPIFYAAWSLSPSS
jgi:DNA-binding response OmpR family regulator